MKLNGFVRNEIVTNTWIRAYAAPFPTPAHAVGGIGWAKGFATGKHQFEEPDSNIKVAIMNKPAIAIWGEHDQTLHADEFLPLFTQLYPTAPVHLLAGAGHYSPEDAPDEITRIVLDFLSTSGLTESTN